MHNSVSVMTQFLLFQTRRGSDSCWRRERVNGKKAPTWPEQYYIFVSACPDVFNPQLIGGGVICIFIVTTFNWLRLCWCNVRSEIKKQFLETVVFNYTYLNISAFKWWRYYIYA